jgi:hypothetical protein
MHSQKNWYSSSSRLTYIADCGHYTEGRQQPALEGVRQGNVGYDRGSFEVGRGGRILAVEKKILYVRGDDVEEEDWR